MKYFSIASAYLPPRPVTLSFTSPGDLTSHVQSTRASPLGGTRSTASLFFPTKEIGDEVELVPPKSRFTFTSIGPSVLLFTTAEIVTVSPFFPTKEIGDEVELVPPK